MPSATTSVAMGSLLDFVGPASSAAPSSDDQPAFDSLLQAPRDASPAPPQRDEHGAPAARSSRDRDDRPASTDSRVKPSSTPDTPANASPTENAGSNQEKKPRNASPPDQPKSQQKDVSPQQEESQSDELIIESLAGLPAITQPIATMPPAEIAVARETTPAEAAAPIAAEDKPKSAATQTAALKTGTATTQITAAQRPIRPPVRELPVQPIAQSQVAENSDKQPAVDANEQLVDERPATENVKPKNHEHVEPAEALTAHKGPPIELVTHQAQTEKDQPQESPRPSGAPITQLDPMATAPSPSDKNPAPITSSSAPPVASQTAAATPGPQPQSNPLPTPPTSIVALPAQPSRLPAEILTQPGRASSRRPAIEVDTTRLLTRVARAFTAAQERDGEIRLRLSPPELGSLRLEVRVHDGALTAHLHTETDTARTAILDNLPALRERLTEQGVRIERFDVDLMQRQPGGMPDQPGGRQQDFPTQPLRTVPPPRSRAVTTASPAPSVPSTTSTQGLNVIV